ncbi:hypothetical protein [Zunongwangia sp. H14]|uniref:hypothetical protein n=1 Tax=Zunongwangia sp. H14 TaxID=3240792 RepID=UPI003566B39B
MKKLLLALLIPILFSCNSTKKVTSNTSDKFVAENLLNNSKAEIKEKYAGANMEEGSGMFEEGTVERSYTILYPETSDEVLITWAADDSGIYEIRFSEEGKWKTASGIKVGTTYEELNRLNGKPVSFYGFGWDYSGAVVWNGGKLENSNLNIFLGPQNEPAEKFYGDQIVKASPGEIKNLDLKVQAVILKKS